MIERVGEALLPCPFCGGEAQMTLDAGRDTVGVECRKCTANMTPSWSHEGAIWAVRAWNTRPNTTDTGFREGVEAAAKVAEEEAEGQEAEGEGGGREWATAKRIATAIRALTEPAKAPAGEGRS